MCGHVLGIVKEFAHLVLGAADSVDFYTCPGRLPSGRTDLPRPASLDGKRGHRDRATSAILLSRKSSTCHTARGP